MRTDKRHRFFNKILNHCLNIGRTHQHAKNGRHTFVNKDTVAIKTIIFDFAVGSLP